MEAVMQTAAQEHVVNRKTDGYLGFIQTKRSGGPITPVFFFLTPYKTRNNGSFTKDICLVSLSYGFPTVFSEAEIGLNYDFYYTTRRGFGPVSFRLEFGARDDMGIALFWQRAKKRWTGTFTGESVAFDGDLIAQGWSVGGLGIYHFNKHIPLRNIDAYFSVGGGMFFNTWVTKNRANKHNDTAVKNSMKLLLFTGMRYYLNRHYSVFAEAGRIGYSTLDLGTSISF
ncbi:MAG: hypothetical protein BGO69_10950 [Bacteroidetes bacterium 46-16]|nr:MAG: hypothetical protein BGO69_10950 [Bacteroidetes bacterium 46-16]